MYAHEKHVYLINSCVAVYIMQARLIICAQFCADGNKSSHCENGTAKPAVSEHVTPECGSLRGTLLAAGAATCLRLALERTLAVRATLATGSARTRRSCNSQQTHFTNHGVSVIM